MADRPILFRDDMVAAILDGRKDVTRRVGPTWAGVQPGTRLWVREAHAILERCCWPDLPHRTTQVLVDPYEDPGPTMPVWCFYRAGFDRTHPRWRPSIHMPRWASRLTLEVVSVERESSSLVAGFLSEDEARREGFASRKEFLAAWLTMHPDYAGVVHRVEFRRLP